MPHLANALDPRQRTHLMRSTQKLGAVLGTTPRLLKSPPSTLAHLSDDPPSQAASLSLSPRPLSENTQVEALHREGRIFSLDAGSTLAPDLSLLESSDFYSPFLNSEISMSLPVLQRSRSMPLPKFKLGIIMPPAQAALILQRPPPRPPASDAHISPKLSPSSATSTEAPLPTLSPTLTNGPTPDFRRRKMAKLTRTLGENIPLELVFGPLETGGDKLSTQNHASRISLELPKPTTAGGLDHTFSVSSCPFGPSSLIRRPSDASIKSTSPKNQPNLVRSLTRKKSCPRPFSANDEDVRLLAKTGREWGRREEKEWSGEWNRGDKDEVLRALRALK